MLDPLEEDRWSQVLGQTLQKILAREKFGARECIVSVPGHLALTKLVKTPSVDRDKRPRIVQFEAGQNIPYNLDEVAWGHVEVSDDGVDLEFMLSAAKLDAMAALCGAVESAGLRVVRCETSSLALWRMSDWGQAAPRSPVLMLDIGARSTHLVFVAAHTIHVRTLAMGGNTITQALASSLQLDFASAEQLKLQVLTNAGDGAIDAISRAALQQAMTGFLERLIMEIMRSRLNFLRQTGAASPTQVIVSGGGSRLPDLQNMLSAKLEIPITPFTIEGRLEMSARARLDGAEQVPEILTNLLGMAVAVVQPTAPMLDLLPPGRAAALGWRRRQPWWLLAAALLVLVPAPAIFYCQSSTAQLNRQISALESVMRPLQLVVAENAGNLERLQKLQTRIQAISRVVDGRTGWVGLLADLQARLGGVGDVWLESMQLGWDAPETEQTDEGLTPMKLALAGRLLDAENPMANASAVSYAQVKTLFASLQESPFVRTVQGERFDNSQPGILRFEVTLILNPNHPL